MKVKNVWIVSTGLVIIVIFGMLTGHSEIAAAAAGALAGWLGAERNHDEE
jgi:hypothetical protein